MYLHVKRGNMLGFPDAGLTVSDFLTPRREPLQMDFRAWDVGLNVAGGSVVLMIIYNWKLVGFAGLDWCLERILQSG